jgi:hypothetical protein
MADKKVTQFTEHTTPVIGADLLPMIGNTAGTPTNYKVQIKNFISQLQIDLPQTAYSALKVTASPTANAAAVQAAAEFGIVANSSIGATSLDRYGLLVSNKIQNGNSSITGRMVAAMFTLDSGNSATLNTNTYGIIINHALDGNVATARVTAPRAFVAVMDDAGTNAAARTTYLFDVGAQGKPVSSNTGTANGQVIFTKVGASSTPSHVLRITVNGTDLWLLASNVAPA